MFYYILNKKIKSIYIKCCIWNLISKILLQIYGESFLLLILIYLNN